MTAPNPPAATARTMARRQKVICIVSMGHSGSTLLDLLLSGHPDVVGVGEVKNLSPAKAPETDCCCGKHVWDCPFWDRVAGVLSEKSALPFRELDLESRDDGTFAAHNHAFFSAVAEVAGRRIIVDSSKGVRRARRLLATSHFDVAPIHLVRGAHGVVYSHLKRGRRRWIAESRSYARRLRWTREQLRGVDHALVRYEDLAMDPIRTLSTLMPRLGLGFQRRQLDWSARERHDAGGNPMRLGSVSVRLDRGWKRGLTVRQKLGISVFSRIPASRKGQAEFSAWKRQRRN